MASGARCSRILAVEFSVRAFNDDLDNKLIKRTCEVWRPRMGRNLSSDEAQQIVSNLSGFFSILVEWEIAESGVRSRPARRHSLQVQRRT